MTKPPARRKRRWGEVETVRPKSPARTVGEVMFERYLNENGLPFRYQPPHIGVRKYPDYLVDTPQGEVIIEVSDFEPGELEKPVAKKLADRRRPVAGVVGAHVAVAVGTMDMPAMQRRIRDKIQEEGRQLKPFLGKYPCVVVLFDDTAHDDYGAPSGTIMCLAMDEVGIVGAVSGFLTKNMNTAISAVAILKMAQPHERLFGRAVRSLRKSRGQQRKPWRRPTREEIMEGFELHEQVDRESSGMMTEKHPHLEIYYNPYASVRLRATALVGPYDVRKRLVPDQAGGFSAVEFMKRKR